MRARTMYVCTMSTRSWGIQELPLDMFRRCGYVRFSGPLPVVWVPYLLTYLHPVVFLVGLEPFKELFSFTIIKSGD